MRHPHSITDRRALAGISAIVALTALANPAGVAAQATVFYACYVPSSGTVYRIKEPGLPQQCSSSTKKGVTVQHVEFSWTDGQGGPGGATDHGVLGGLNDDDHSQYLLTAGKRTSVDGFAVEGTLGQGVIPATGAGTRFMWYPAKAALRAGWIQSPLWDAAKIGLSSVALGSDVEASGGGAVALGIAAAARGNGSVALGTHATADGTEATAMGSGAGATGANSGALGRHARATSTESIAIGPYTTASGAASTAIGERSTASGYKSMALGNWANTNGKLGAVVMSTGAYGVEVKAAADYQFVVRASRFWFGNNENVTAPAGQLIATSTGAYLTTGGAWVNSSDVNRKDNFEAVDGETVLGTLASMPIQTWNYRDEDESVRHMGPTAQDFRAAFGLGASETAIATVDADGVGLAAIQALAQRTAELKRENAALRTDVRALTERVDQLLRASRCGCH